MELSSQVFQPQNVGRHLKPRLDIEINLKHMVMYLVYSLGLIFITAILSYGYSSGLFSGLSPAAAGYIFTAFFFLVGTAHIFTFPKWLSNLDILLGRKALLYSFLFAVLLSAFILFLFSFFHLQQNGLAVAAGCAFILPYAFNQCWVYYEIISRVHYKGWVVPADTVIDKKMSLLLNSLFFKIKIKMDYSDNSEKIFSITVPERLTLGKAFCHFLYDKKNTAVMVDDSLQSYAWRFSANGKFGKRLLYPDKSLKKNGIEESDIILIERIKL